MGGYGEPHRLLPNDRTAPSRRQTPRSLPRRRLLIRRSTVIPAVPAVVPDYDKFVPPEHRRMRARTRPAGGQQVAGWSLV
jgi:hypothetical protein